MSKKKMLLYVGLCMQILVTNATGTNGFDTDASRMPSQDPAGGPASSADAAGAPAPTAANAAGEFGFPNAAGALDHEHQVPPPLASLAAAAAAAGADAAPRPRRGSTPYAAAPRPQSPASSSEASNVQESEGEEDGHYSDTEEDGTSAHSPVTDASTLPSRDTQLPQSPASPKNNFAWTNHGPVLGATSNPCTLAYKRLASACQARDKVGPPKCAGGMVIVDMDKHKEETESQLHCSYAQPFLSKYGTPQCDEIKDEEERKLLVTVWCEYCVGRFCMHWGWYIFWCISAFVLLCCCCPICMVCFYASRKRGDQRYETSRRQVL